MITIVTVLFLIVTFLMIVVILMQSSKSDGGVGAGFGALGGTQVFGGRGPADVLKKFTTYLAVIYGALTIVLAYLHRTSSDAVNVNPLLQNNTAAEQTTPQAQELQTPDLSKPTNQPITTDSTN